MKRLFKPVREQSAPAQRSVAEKMIESIKCLFKLHLPPYILLAAIWEVVEHGPNIVQKYIR